MIPGLQAVSVHVAPLAKPVKASSRQGGAVPASVASIAEPRVVGFTESLISTSSQ